MKKAKARILILYASVGNGHRVAATAVEETLKSIDKDIVVAKKDLFDFSKAKIAAPISKLHTKSKITGAIYDFLWKSENLNKIGEKILPIIFDNFSPLRKYVLTSKPNVVICTHALAAQLISDIRQKSKLNFKHVVIITDFRPHSYWSVPQVDLYCAPDVAAKLDLIKLGVAGNKIMVTGIPLRKQFLESKKNHGGFIDRKFKGVIIITGDIQKDKGLSITKGANQLIGSLKKLGIHTTVVCGRNIKLRRALTKYYKKYVQAGRLRIFGYVDKIADLIKQHSVLITKPGGLICAEALALNIPTVLIRSDYGGQEDANSQYLVDNGFAVAVKTMSAIPSIILELSTGSVLSEIREKIRLLPKRNSPKIISDEVLKIS